MDEAATIERRGSTNRTPTPDFDGLRPSRNRSLSEVTFVTAPPQLRQSQRLGGVYLNNRYHDPALGSFLSVDPLVTTTGEPYLYGSGNPTTLSDPDGLCPYAGCWEAFDAYLRGLRQAAVYRQGADELEPGSPLPLYRVIGHAERSAAASLAFNTPIGIGGVVVEGQVTPTPAIGPHLKDSGTASFTLGVTTGLCIYLCLEIGISGAGPYARPGVGVAIDTPGIVIDDVDPECGSGQTRAYVSVGAGPVQGFVAGVRPGAGSSWRSDSGFGIALPDGGLIPSYKGLSGGGGVVREWDLC